MMTTKKNEPQANKVKSICTYIFINKIRWDEITAKPQQQQQQKKNKNNEIKKTIRVSNYDGIISSGRNVQRRKLEPPKNSNSSKFVSEREKSEKQQITIKKHIEQTQLCMHKICAHRHSPPKK